MACLSFKLRLLSIVIFVLEPLVASSCRLKDLWLLKKDLGGLEACATEAGSERVDESSVR